MSKKKVAQVPVKATPGPTVAERILDIVASGYDAQKIAHALAKKHPTLFLELYQQVAAPVLTWHKDVVQSLYAGNVVSAIKLMREKTGLGLKEAKDVCDNLRVQMAAMGYMISATGFTAAPLNGDLTKILNELNDTAFRCK